MTRWIRSHPFTLLGVFLLAAVVTVNVAWPLHWWEYLWCVAGGAGNAVYGRVTRRHRRHSAGPSLPCPAGCRIRVAHSHESFR